MLNAVQGAEVRHDAVERFRRRQCIEERREVVEAARQHRGTPVEAGVRQATQRSTHHLLRRIAGNDVPDGRGQKGGVEPRAAPDLEHPCSRAETSREGLVRALPEQLKDLTGGKCVVLGRQPIEGHRCGGRRACHHEIAPRDTDFTPTVESTGGDACVDGATLNPAARE